MASCWVSIGVVPLVPGCAYTPPPKFNIRNLPRISVSPAEWSLILVALYLKGITTPKFNSSPLKSYLLPNRKPDRLPVPPFFRGKLAVKLRGCIHLYWEEFPIPRYGWFLNGETHQPKPSCSTTMCEGGQPNRYPQKTRVERRYILQGPSF